MSLTIDFIAIFGGILISLGVYLAFGLAFALICAGALLIMLAVRASVIHGDVHVSDS